MDLGGIQRKGEYNLRWFAIAARAERRALPALVATGGDAVRRVGRREKTLLCAGVRHFRGVSRSLLIRGLVLLFGCAGIAAHAAFSSIYIFGDSVSTTTTNNPSFPTNLYYGKRYNNGRTWVEVLAQRQGLGTNSIVTNTWAYSSNNLSFFGHYSPLMVTNVRNFTPPANVSNCLFVVWVCNADFVGDLFDAGVGDPANAPQNGTNLAVWTAAISQHLTNHFKVFTNLYGKGVRTIIAPNVVNVAKAPFFAGFSTGNKAFIRARVVSFNTNFLALTKQVEVASPGLKIIVPDIFAVFDAALTNAASYGLTNALDTGGNPIDALDNGYTGLNSAGANYIFWDYISPTARMNELFADVAQQALSPVDLAGMAQVNTSNRLDIVNVPVGLNGTVLYVTNLTQPVWLTNSTFSSLTLTQGVFVTPTNAQRFYQVKFPYAWTWP